MTLERGLRQMGSPVAVLISGYDSPEGPAFDRDVEGAIAMKGKPGWDTTGIEELRGDTIRG
jgi:hypothetical protein